MLWSCQQDITQKARAKVGSWIVLTEYGNNGKKKCVKAEYVRRRTHLRVTPYIDWLMESLLKQNSLIKVKIRNYPMKYLVISDFLLTFAS